MSSPLLNSGQATPSGTVTFLFTDIEGSTKLAQEYPDELPALLSRHNDILNQAIQKHNGYVFQIVGDSFSAAFQNAVDAVSAQTSEFFENSEVLNLGDHLASRAAAEQSNQYARKSNDPTTLVDAMTHIHHQKNDEKDASPTINELLKPLSSDEQARIWNEVEDALGAYMTPAGFEVQHHVLVACGGKS